jgi:hypothetical protein
MANKQYRNNFKDMRPHVAKHVGREIFNAALADSNAENVNLALRQADITNPDGRDVVFSDAHLNQMKSGIRTLFALVQETAPHRMQEAFDLVISMHTGGFYGPWYVAHYIPYALNTGQPLWIPVGKAQEVVQELKYVPTDVVLDCARGHAAPVLDI